MKFKQLNINASLLEAINKIGFEQLTPVQEQVIPAMLEGKDCLVQSKTGSGKTAAFAIPVIEKIDWEKRYPQVLVLTPTRELALQVKEDIDAIGLYKRIKCTAIFGKQPYKFQVQDLKQKCHVVVGTPGRVLDHIERETMHLEEIETVVIDEADEMLKMGFIEIVKEIISHIPNKHLTCMFSATMPEEVKEIAQNCMKEPVLITIENKTPKQIEQRFMKVSEEEKEDTILPVLVKENKDSVIVFARMKDRVDELYDLLKSYDMLVEKLHGGMMQEDRLKSLKKFRQGNCRILVATDVAARGLDIEDVGLILNYDLPDKVETYVHRVGRSGRMDKKGEAISFVGFHDRVFMEELETTNIEINWIEKEVYEGMEEIDFVNNPYQEVIEIKKEKHEEIKKECFKIYIGAGKSKKMRAGDIVGAICEINGITGEDIGVIQIQDHQSYVDILHNKGEIVLKALQKKTIKGKKVRVEKAQN